jgi:hypothetical protein
MLRALKIAAPAVALVCALAQPAGSSSVIRMTDQDLVERADFVFHGKCTGKSTAADDASGLIFTDYSFDVIERLKGDGDAPTTFTFRALGGFANGRGLAIAGAPEYGVGEEVVTFLDKPNKNGARITIGLGQGKFSVVLDPSKTLKFVERDLDGLKVVDPKTGRVLDGSKEPRRPFDPFMDEIRGLVKKR